MKITIPAPIPQHVMAELRDLVSEGATQEQVIRAMRGLGLHKIESVKAFRTLFGGPLNEAKLAVHQSETWADRRQFDDEFHGELESASAELASPAALRAREDDVLHTAS